MLVDITKVVPPELAPGLVLDIRYATKNNFVGVPLYSEAKCFLQEGTARKLVKVVEKLKLTLMLGIKIFDGYRPLSVQRALWEICPDPRYVADPAEGSKHNRGSAVDLTLIDLRGGEEMEMGTDFDDFTEKAHYDFVGDLLKTAISNRRILREMMMEYGFQPIETEWWHFDDSDWNADGGRRFPLLDIPFSELG